MEAQIKQEVQISKSKNYTSFAGGDVTAPTRIFLELQGFLKPNYMGCKPLCENIPSQNSSCWLVLG
jgi:hypothetical protein